MMPATSSSGLSALRLVRVLRVVRVMGIFQNLNMLVAAFLRCATPPDRTGVVLETHLHERRSMF